MAQQQGTDFIVSNHGSVWSFRPVSETARAKVDELGLEDWQFMGGSFCVDWRPARDLAEALADEGFILEAA